VSNSSRQADIFGNDLSGDKARCNNQACFREKQRAYLTEHWPAGYEVNTTGFVFSDEGKGYNWYHSIYDWKLQIAKKAKRSVDKCLSCPSYITILELKGKINQDLACVGEAHCYKQIYEHLSRGEKSESKSANHGQEFREKLYQNLIPSLAAGLDNDDIRQLRLTLAAMLHTSHAALMWFRDTYTEKKEDSYYYHVSGAWKIIETMDKDTLWQIIRKAVALNIKQEDFGHQARHMIALHLGVNLKHDWIITEEYLKKKTIPEILALGSSLKIFTDEKAVAFRDNTIKAKKFEACRKKDLISIILESGVDLAGKVPQEILDVKKNSE
jgi:hypothetical protein